jgi:hypothetical protein
MRKKTGKRRRMAWQRTIFLGTLITGGLLLGLPYLLPGPRPPSSGFARQTEAFPCPPDRIELLIDSTGYDPETGERILDHEIFDRVLDMIARADDFIFVDFFLWNPWTGTTGERDREPALELAGALIARKLENPDLPILVLTDPINRIYGEDEPGFFDSMAASGIPVVFSDLARLPDSNRLYAPLARFYGPLISVLLTPTGVLDRRWLNNPFDLNLGPISLRQYGRMLYFKANHRKVVVTRSDDLGIEMVVGSLNPSDGSAAHSNLAVHVSGPAAQAALGTELSVARWSATSDTVLSDHPDRLEDTIRTILGRTSMAWDDYLTNDSTARVTWLTESKIRNTILDTFASAGPDDAIDITMFYLSDRKVVRAIKAAARRGAHIRMVLDANRDAFGRKKIGIPNRPVAAELMGLAKKHPIEIRWADTRGEQFHPKAMVVTRQDGKGDLLLIGSANWTRRNLGDLNLEGDVLILNPGPAADDYRAWFNQVWLNAECDRSLDYDEWGLTGWGRFWKTALYRVQEALGAGTF